MNLAQILLLQCVAFRKKRIIAARKYLVDDECIRPEPLVCERVQRAPSWHESEAFAEHVLERFSPASLLFSEGVC
ncbi:MAG: hypothetical protein ACTTH5_07125, partial [Wolinella sp.]